MAISYHLDNVVKQTIQKLGGLNQVQQYHIGQNTVTYFTLRMTEQCGLGIVSWLWSSTWLNTVGPFGEEEQDKRIFGKSADRYPVTITESPTYTNQKL